MAPKAARTQRDLAAAWTVEAHEYTMALGLKSCRMTFKFALYGLPGVFQPRVVQLGAGSA